MKFSNFHTHSIFCDGNDEIEAYIKRAIQLDFDAIGFSGHAPVHIPCDWTMDRSIVKNYISVIKSLREKYKDEIEVYTGMEVDYFPGISGSSSPEIKELNLDYTISSVHFMRDSKSSEYLTVDGPIEGFKKIINVFFNGNVKAFVRSYYELIQNMVIEHKPEIVGHLDLIKKHNKNGLFFDENSDWYKDEVLKTLKVIKNFNSILEINTGGISRGYMKFPYPSKWILEECKKLDIPLMLNADAHSAVNLDTYFKEAVEELREVGYEYIYTIKENKWIKRVLK